MPWHRWCMHVSVWGTQRDWGCLCRVLRRTKWLCKMSPVLGAGWNFSCHTNEAILKGKKKIHLVLGGSFASVSILERLLFARTLLWSAKICSPFSQQLVIQTVQWCLFVNKSMSLLYLNNRGWHLLWEPVWFSGLVGYFDVSQRKKFT